MTEAQRKAEPTLVFKERQDAMVPRSAASQPQSDINAILNVVAEAVGNRYR